MRHRDRFTRDGTRRRRLRDLWAQRGGAADNPNSAQGPNDPRDPANPHAPRSEDDSETERDNAEAAATAAAAAAAAFNTAAAIAAAKTAARAAAKSRAGSNATGSGSATATSAAAAAEAETAAAQAAGSIALSLPSTYTCTAPECRNRGGTATLNGFSEYTSASTPPKKYLTQTLSGDVGICTWGNNNCSGSLSNANMRRDSYSGDYVYNASTGAMSSNSQAMARYNQSASGSGACSTLSSRNNSTGSFSSLSATTPFSNSLDNDRTSVSNTSATRKTLATNSACNNATFSITGQGVAYADLSDEDTEQDAIDRMLTAASWGSWAGASSSTCLARWENRTSGFSLTYRDAEFRDTISIPENDTGIVKVGIYRRAYGSSDSWELYSISVFFVEGDSNDEDEITLTVTTQRGYESYAACLPIGS